MASRATVIKVQSLNHAMSSGLIRLGLHNLAAAIETVGGDVMPAMGFAAGFVNRNGRLL